MSKQILGLSPRIQASLRELKEVGAILFSQLESDYEETREHLLKLLETDARQGAASNPICAVIYCTLLGLSSFENTYDRFVRHLEEQKSENHSLEIQDLETIDSLVSSGPHLAEIFGDDHAESILSALQLSAGKTPLATALYAEILCGLVDAGKSSREKLAAGGSTEVRWSAPLTPSSRRRFSKSKQFANT